MEKNQQQDPNNKQNNIAANENETLQNPGANVQDYGNVSGGSAAENSQANDTSGSRGNDSSDTIGNP